MSIIQNKDIYDPSKGNPFKPILEMLDILDQKIESTKKHMVGLESTLRSVNKTGSGAEAKIILENTTKLNAETERLNALTKAEQQIKQQLIATEAKLVASYSAEAEQLNHVKIETQVLNKLKLDEAKLDNQLIGAYEKASIKLNQLRKQYKDLAIQNKENNKEGKALLANIQNIDAKLKKVDASVGQFQRNVGNYVGALNKNLMKMGGIIAGYFSIDTIISFGKSIVETTANFEKFGIILENTLGSKSQADAALKMVSDFAAETPFSVDELTASFVKLANQGFIPTKEQMVLLGDLASSTGKSFDQLIEGLLDAQTGEFERLKEFGIRAKKSGDEVTFSFKGVDTTVKATNENIRNYILSLGKLEGVQGANAKIAKSLSGQLSNLGDSWSQLLVALGEGSKGLTTSILSDLKTTLDDITKTIRDINDESLSTTDRFRALTNVLQYANPVLTFFQKQLIDTKYGLLSLIPGLERAIDGFKEFFGIKDPAKAKLNPYMKRVYEMQAANKLALKQLEAMKNASKEANKEEEKSKATKTTKTGVKQKENDWIQEYLDKQKAAQAHTDFIKSQEDQMLADERAYNDAIKAEDNAKWEVLGQQAEEYEKKLREQRAESINYAMALGVMYTESEEELLKKRKELLMQAAIESAEILGQLVAEGELSIKSFSKFLLTTALNVAEKMILLSIGNIWAKSIEQGLFAGIAKAAILTALVKGIFAGIKSKVQGFAEGTEYVNGAGTEKSDSIHAKLSKGERVVPAEINKQLMGISNKDLPKIINNGLNSYRLESLLNKVDENTSKAAYYLSNFEIHHEDGNYRYYKDVKTGVTHRIIKD